MASEWASKLGQTIEPASWAECLDLLLSSGGGAAIYRGHKVFDWELESTLERALRKHAEEWDEEKHLVMQSMVKHYPTEKWASDAENALTQGFRLEATRMRLPDIPPAWDTLGWWEVMQHHRTPTRLLDWTSSPFIALWFAVEDHEDTDGDMALWIYDRGNMSAKLHGLMAKLKDTEDYQRADERRFQNRLVELATESGVGFLIPVAPRQFPRAVAQQSVLTVSTDVVVGLPASRWARRKLATCVRLKKEWKPEIQAACRSMGLSRVNLFRDFDSLGDQVKEIFMSSREVPGFY